MIISSAAVIASINSLTALLDVSGPGEIRIYTTGSGIPADVSVAITDQVELAVLPLSATAFPTATDNADGTATATANAITSDTTAAAGTATWFRAYDGAGLAVIDGDAGLAVTDLILDDVVFELNDTVNVNSWAITLAE